MPTILKIGPYRFFFYSREDGEPIHIHVIRERFEAKFWLDPVRLANNEGFAQHELKRLESIVAENKEVFQNAWQELKK